MARPCKSAKVLTDCSQTKSEIAERIKQEDKLKGSDNKISPPTYLNARQKKIFKYIVEQLRASEILGNLDIYILATCSIAIDRLQEIEKIINEDITKLTDKDLLSAKDKYTKDFFRCCNEISLSPQSRSKLSNINLQAKQNEVDPLAKAINGDGNGN
jgi:P27 family predicted phage terminase small subunit